uniref:Uncharacterized protein n=1 Tax=Odontella aurita TaxID=265563 RepID=A0A7S4K8F4_9STRA|mmetsp:Transcript_63557/g.187625  ORF Transcript_63557/g.187625 Transcript_63557/m.187625 type:complete len:497 (+) Transcript_63557:121-1611(+)
MDVIEEKATESKESGGKKEEGYSTDMRMQDGASQNPYLASERRTPGVDGGIGKTKTIPARKRWEEKRNKRRAEGYRKKGEAYENESKGGIENKEEGATTEDVDYSREKTGAFPSAARVERGRNRENGEGKFSNQNFKGGESQTKLRKEMCLDENEEMHSISPCDMNRHETRKGSDQAAACLSSSLTLLSPPMPSHGTGVEEMKDEEVALDSIVDAASLSQDEMKGRDRNLIDGVDSSPGVSQVPGRAPGAFPNWGRVRALSSAISSRFLPTRNSAGVEVVQAVEVTDAKPVVYAEAVNLDASEERFRRSVQKIFRYKEQHFQSSCGMAGASVEDLRGTQGAVFEGHAEILRSGNRSPLARCFPCFYRNKEGIRREKGYRVYILVKGKFCFIFKSSISDTPAYAIPLDEYVAKKEALDEGCHEVKAILMELKESSSVEYEVEFNDTKKAMDFYSAVNLSSKRTERQESNRSASVAYIETVGNKKVEEEGLSQLIHTF